MIHTGDAIEVMAELPEDSVDAVVTDPPYGLEFMGKGWDKFGAVVEHPDDGEGPWGRTARVRYGAGRSFMEWCEVWGRAALRVTKPGGYLLAFGGTRTHHRLVCGLEDAGWIIRDELDWIYASGFPKGKANLKPAHEPIVLARKPGPLRPLGIDECRIETTDELVFGSREIGTNGIYRPIAKDRQTEGEPHPAGRWPSNVILSDPELFDESNPEVVGSGAVTASGDAHILRRGGTTGAGMGFGSSAAGNVLDATYGDSGGYSRFFIVPKADREEREPVLRGQLEKQPAAIQMPSNASKYERKDGAPGLNLPRENVHPTVKPLDLMRHLVRLVTPPGGTVLDPFAGSGSTLIAAEMEGCAWIGVEQSPEYVTIAEARLNGTQRGLGLDVPAPTRKRALPSDEKLAELGKTYPRRGWMPDFRDEEPAA